MKMFKKKGKENPCLLFLLLLQVAWYIHTEKMKKKIASIFALLVLRPVILSSFSSTKSSLLFLDRRFKNSSFSAGFIKYGKRTGVAFC